MIKKKQKKINKKKSIKFKEPVMPADDNHFDKFEYIQIELDIIMEKLKILRFDDKWVGTNAVNDFIDGIMERVNNLLKLGE